MIWTKGRRYRQRVKEGSERPEPKDRIDVNVVCFGRRHCHQNISDTLLSESQSPPPFIGSATDVYEQKYGTRSSNYPIIPDAFEEETRLDMNLDVCEKQRSHGTL